MRYAPTAAGHLRFAPPSLPLSATEVDFPMLVGGDAFVAGAGAAGG